MTLIRDVQNLLERKLHTSLRLSWLEAHLLQKNGSLEVANSSLNSLANAIEEELLNTDLGLACLRSLPDNVSQIERGVVGSSSAHLVQIEELVNIGQSLEHRYEDSPHRTLKMTLHDGVQRVAALEVTRISQLNLTSPLGMKALVKNALVCHGVLCLHPHNLEILGGCVEPLNEYAKLSRVQQKKSLIPKEWEDELGAVELSEAQDHQVPQKDASVDDHDLQNVPSVAECPLTPVSVKLDRGPSHFPKSEHFYVVPDVTPEGGQSPPLPIATSNSPSRQPEHLSPTTLNAAYASYIAPTGEADVLSDSCVEPCEVLEESLEREIEDLIFRVESSKKTRKENFLVELANFDLEDADMIYSGHIHSKDMEAVEDSQFTEFE
ncbi:uncharacterized protein LOC126319866 [Schistocerca gregaria]|uniref:uncharacterized protein LOC126319866 n=1 Tax=Schistocerca gregaria TaxID=7010 RepID=UPI00211EA732|nr:uncharacterized protein LOC126319866 [Schistocerca gregaria]